MQTKTSHARTLTTLLMLMAALAIGCGSVVQPPRPAGEWSDGQAPALEPLIREHCAPFVADGKSIGLSIAVVSPTQATVMAFGHPSVASSQPVRGDTLYEIGSITKTFTAIALAREIESGALRLDQPVQEVLPAGMSLPKAAQGVTLKHLTTHTSGIPSLPDNLSMLHAFWMIIKGGNPYSGYSESDFREAVRDVELESAPGKKFEYSNFAMDLLGYVLSKKGGADYEAYIKRQVCEPLGMRDTTVTLSPDQSARFAQEYAAVRKEGSALRVKTSTPWDLPSHLAGSGALRSTAADMLIYLKANMRPAGPLAGAISQTHQTLYRDQNGTVVGMNWIRSPIKSLGQVVIWHNGGMGGARSYLGFTEDGKVGVVILSNVAESVDELGLKILIALAKSANRD